MRPSSGLSCSLKPNLNLDGTDSPHRETGNFSSDIKTSRGGLIFITERDCVVVFDKAPIILKK